MVLPAALVATEVVVTAALLRLLPPPVLRLPERVIDAPADTVGKYAARAESTSASAARYDASACAIDWLPPTCCSKASRSGSPYIFHHCPRGTSSAGAATRQSRLSLNAVGVATAGRT